MSADDGTLGLMMSGQRGAGDLANAYVQSSAELAQGRYEASSLRLNARLAERNAADAIARGRTEGLDLSRSVQRLRGAQISSYAAQGVDVSTGTPADVLQETDRLGREDQKRVANNAWREAYGFRSEAAELRARANMARIAARFRSTSTLATGGMRAAREFLAGWREYRKPPDSGSGIDPATGYPRITTG